METFTVNETIYRYLLLFTVNGKIYRQWLLFTANKSQEYY